METRSRIRNGSTRQSQSILLRYFIELARRQQPYDLIDKNSFRVLFWIARTVRERLFNSVGSELNLDHFVAYNRTSIQNIKEESYCILFRMLDLDNDGELCATELETMLRHSKKARPTHLKSRRSLLSQIRH